MSSLQANAAGQGASVLVSNVVMNRAPSAPLLQQVWPSPRELVSSTRRALLIPSSESEKGAHSVTRDLPSPDGRHAGRPAAAGRAEVAAAPEASSAPEDVGRVVFADRSIRRALMRMAHEILERNEAPELLYLVAIPNGGVPLARQLARNIHEIAEVEVEVGVLDTTLYRDDLATRSERPALRETVMPSEVDERVVVLVDDVVKTGRTIRAAMDALMDFGRPRSVQVVGLIDRGHRELPIKIDFVGKNLPTHSSEMVRLQGARSDGEGPLEIVVLSTDTMVESQSASVTGEGA